MKDDEFKAWHYVGALFVGLFILAALMLLLPESQQSTTPEHYTEGR